MLDKLPFLQKFLTYLSRNIIAVLLLTNALAVAMDVYMIRWVRDLTDQKAKDDRETIIYERQTKDQLIDITKEQLKKEINPKEKNEN